MMQSIGPLRMKVVEKYLIFSLIDSYLAPHTPHALKDLGPIHSTAERKAIHHRNPPKVWRNGGWIPFLEELHPTVILKNYKLISHCQHQKQGPKGEGGMHQLHLTLRCIPSCQQTGMHLLMHLPPLQQMQHLTCFWTQLVTCIQTHHLQMGLLTDCQLMGMYFSVEDECWHQRGGPEVGYGLHAWLN